MGLKNYTGSEIGLTDKNGNPMRVLSPIGRAEVTPNEEVITAEIDNIPIIRRRRGIVKYLPAATGNLDDIYIVSKEVAEASRGKRFDLVVVEDPITILGGTFYRKLLSA